MINTSVFQNKKAAYYTLGCKLNFSETSTFGKMLSELGVRQAEEGEQADICLINTCSVTEVADHKCRQAIHRMVRQNPGAFMVVTGCYAQLESEAVSRIESVDLVLGSNEKADLVQFLSDAWTAKETATYARSRSSRSLRRAREAIAHAISSRYRTAATITARTAPFLMHVATHATPPSLLSSVRRVRRLKKAERR